jgi:hypothetical protein
MPQTLLFELNDVRVTWVLAQFGRTSYQERPPHADVARAWLSLSASRSVPVQARAEAVQRPVESGLAVRLGRAWTQA